MFPGYASRLYNEMKALYKKKTSKIEPKPTNSDNGPETSKIEPKPTKSDNGPKTSKIEPKPTKNDNGPKTLKIEPKPTESVGGEKIFNRLLTRLGLSYYEFVEKYGETLIGNPSPDELNHELVSMMREDARRMRK